MKKYLTAIIITTSTYSASYAIDVSKCEKFGSDGKRGDWIVKCDMTDEMRQIQTDTPNAMFLSAGADFTTPAEMQADTEHVYINIVPSECGPNTTGYRVLTKTNPETKMYATIICE